MTIGRSGAPEGVEIRFQCMKSKPEFKFTFSMANAPAESADNGAVELNGLENLECVVLNPLMLLLHTCSVIAHESFNC